jgi:TolB-like protein/Flp pilus assembly protein TadD
VTDPGKAVFLSYASQDADAAGRICEALRAAGIEVWFDQSELRGGDAWDRQIRKQIHDCALFVPVISAHSDARHEGYFRREWRLAVERTGDMAEDVAFLLPVVVDNTPDATARVPDRFREVQWSRLSDGQTTPAFVERVRRLLSPASPSVNSSRASVAPGAAALIRQPFRPSWLSRRSLLVMVAVIIAALAYWDVDRFWISKRQVSPPAPPTAPRAAAPAAFSPPPHSIAVLPFVNMSGDKEQEYFSDGLTEELLNSLAEINELQVAARTSSFYFKGKDVDLGTVAHKLNVGAVLEGSVRRSGHTIRITAQLINAVTGFHLWSKTYDRDLGDVLKLQTEIATAVASALKVTLLGDVAAKVELGGTSNSGAFDAYLREAKAYSSKHEAKEIPAAIAAYTEAIRLDPHYALAFAARSIALATYTAAEAATKAAMREGFDKAQADARQALALAPDLAWAHLALANVSELGTLDFTQASDAYKRALALAPGNAEVLRLSGKFAAYMGQFDAAVAAARRAVVLDPLARASHSVLGRTLYVAHRYQEAIDALAEVLSLDPDYKDTYAYRGFAYYGAGDLQSARASCETQPDYWGNQYCLAITYDRLGRHADAEAELAKMKAVVGDTASYQYATVYAQWGNRAQALDWLETALRVRDPGLEFLKTDPLLDPLRKEPRFQAIERDLKFPT